MKLSRLIPLLGLALVASCDKGETPVVPEDPIPSTFTKLTVTSEVLSKANMEDGSLTWAAGDSIAILSAGKRTVFTTASAGKSVEFSGGSVAAGQNTVYAVYPCDTSVKIDGGKLKVKIPAKQHLGSAVADSTATLSAGLVKYSNKKFAAEMKNLCSYVEVEIKGSAVKSVAIQGNDNEIIAGGASVDLSKSTFEIVDSTASSLTATLFPKGSSFAPGKYLVAVFPKALAKGYTISYEVMDDTTSYKKVFHSTEAVSFEGGKIFSIASKEDVALAQRVVNLGTFYSDVANSKYFDGVVPTSTAKYFGSFNTPITERVDFPYCFSSPNGLYKYSGKSCVRIANKFELPFFAHKKLVTINIKTAISLNDGILKDSQDESVGSVLCPDKKATLNTFTSTVEGEKYSITKSGNIDIVAIVFTYEGPDVEEVCAVTVDIPAPEGQAVLLSGKMYAFNFGGSTSDYTAGFEYKLATEENYTTAAATFDGREIRTTISSLAPGEYTFRAYAKKGTDKAIYSQDRKFTIATE